MKTRLNLLVATTMLTGLATTGYSAVSVGADYSRTASLEQRVTRLEKMAQNPVLLQLIQRLERQEQEMQDIQDRLDHLERSLSQLKQQVQTRYAQEDERISALETEIDALKQRQLQGRQRLQSGMPLIDESLSTSETGSIPVPNPSLPSSPKRGLTPQNLAAQSSQRPSKHSAPDQKSTQAIETHFPTEEEKLAYKSAFQLVKDSKFAQAEKAFDIFQKRYPQSKLAANAAYWQGEVRLLQKKYPEALAAFNKVINQYPNSLKVPDALLRKADTLVLMEKKDEAKKLYLELKKKYPNAKAAKNVTKRLQILEDSENAGTTKGAKG